MAVFAPTAAPLRAEIAALEEIKNVLAATREHVALIGQETQSAARRRACEAVAEALVRLEGAPRTLLHLKCRKAAL